MITHLCSVKLRQDFGELEIACHPEATHITCKAGKAVFRRVNPRPIERMIEIPKGTNSIIFESYRRYHGWIDYGIMRFISHKGNILKIENYNR